MSLFQKFPQPLFWLIIILLAGAMLSALYITKYWGEIKSNKKAARLGFLSAILFATAVSIMGLYAAFRFTKTTQEFVVALLLIIIGIPLLLFFSYLFYKSDIASG